MTTLKKNTFGERYVSLPTLKLSESNVKDESDRDVLQDWKNKIESSLINLNPDAPSTVYKYKIFKFFLNLITTRLNNLNRTDRLLKTTNRDNENELIINELKQHVSGDVFSQIIRKVRERKIHEK